jgi:hypothetical protein
MAVVDEPVSRPLDFFLLRTGQALIVSDIQVSLLRGLLCSCLPDVGA